VPTSPVPAVVLGVDPGLTRCGIGVVAGPPGRPVHLHHDCVRTAPDLALERRLAQLHDAVAAAIATHRPVLVAVERVLFSKNVRTAMGTGHAAGVIMLAAAQAGLPVVQLTPNDVKASVAGDGGADKDGVARMVVAQLGLDATPRPADAADALAVALAALVRMRATNAATAPPRGLDAPTANAPATSWEQVVADRGLTVAGGTAPPRTRPRP
jgi:crossover junction endodeoxyribonuclease RuvC